MLFIFSIPVLIRHLWQFKTVVLLHCCLICAVLFLSHHNKLECSPLITRQYHLPRLQEIVVTMSTANMMVPHAVPEQNQNKNVLMTKPST